MRSETLDRIHANGILGLRWAAESTLREPERPRDSGALDCKIGNVLCAELLRGLPADAPPDVRAYFETQRREENLHCAAKPWDPKELEFAQRVAGFHLKTLQELGWTGVAATMMLTGERMAMGTAVGELMVRRDHPEYEPQSVHGLRPEFFAHEFRHTTTPLLLLALHATDEQLERALAAQEGFLNLLGVPRA